MLTTAQMNRITKEVVLKLPPSVTTKEALAFREKIAVEIAEMTEQGVVPDMAGEIDMTEEPPTCPSASSNPLPLDPHATTLAAIREPLTPDERLWLARMISAHGEVEVIRMWPSLAVQLEFARSL